MIDSLPASVAATAASSGLRSRVSAHRVNFSAPRCCGSTWANVSGLSIFGTAVTCSTAPLTVCASLIVVSFGGDAAQVIHMPGVRLHLRIADDPAGDRLAVDAQHLRLPRLLAESDLVFALQRGVGIDHQAFAWYLAHSSGSTSACLSGTRANRARTAARVAAELSGSGGGSSSRNRPMNSSPASRIKVRSAQAWQAEIPSGTPCGAVPS